MVAALDCAGDKHHLPNDVAGGEDVLRRGLHVLIDLDIAFAICLYAGNAKIEGLRIGYPSDSYDDRMCCKRMLSTLPAVDELQGIAITPDLIHPIEALNYHHAAGAIGGGHRRRYILILYGKDARRDLE